jgi:hypothetical protein
MPSVVAGVVCARLRKQQAGFGFTKRVIEPAPGAAGCWEVVRVQ